MNTGRFVLSQVLDLVHRQTLDRLALRYHAEDRVRHFGCRQQLICMVFAQLTWRESLRDIEACLNAKTETLYHLGFTKPIARATLAEANEGRDWRLWRDLAMGLVAKARRLYASEDLGIELDHTVYALNSTTIDLSLTLFGWADFRSTKAGIKITPARLHDVRWLDELIFESGAFYVIDRAYVDFVRLARVATANAFFVTRAKDNLRFTRHQSRPVNFADGLRSDQIGNLTIWRSRKSFPWPLRKVRYFDEETRRDLVFLTHHLEVPALSVARLYKLRWRVELFFRWIKQNLRIKHFYGNSINAVKSQIWIAVTVYLIVAILHKELKLPGSLHRTMQILSVHPFEKVSIHQLLTDIDAGSNMPETPNQLMLW